MDAFVTRLLSLPPLDPDHEHELALRSRAGDAAARTELIESALRLVPLHALRLGARGETLMDAVQAGSVGLIEAVDRFDPDRGVRLATYAWPWIAHAVGTVLREREHTAPWSPLGEDEPPSLVTEAVHGLETTLAEVLRVRHRLDGTPGPARSREVVAVHLGLSVSQVRTREGEAMRQLRGRLAKVVHRAEPQGEADPP
jgi:RNA polymerase sigma factor (sigma-70 family)